MSVNPLGDTLEAHSTGNGSPLSSPFLRWAGGKRWLVPQILDLVGGSPVKRYHEPFMGGGSVFFSLAIGEKAFLSDLNDDLMEVYRQVRDYPAAVAECLSSFRNTSAEYYAARASSPTQATHRAARFIFLNHTSYNGIFRVNLKGEYNVPFGSRKNVNMPDQISLARASKQLQGAVLLGRDFDLALADVQEGDLVFLDPPYTVAHNNNGFVKYNQHLFSFEDQERLAEAIERVKNLGADFILTNAAHSSIDKLFSPLGQKLTVSRRNSVGGKNAARGSAEEFIFTSLGIK